MKKRGRYSTKQQELLLDCIEKQKGTFCSISQIMAYMRKENIQIGQTTVYRALERLADDSMVLKIPSVDGEPAQYSFTGASGDSGFGQLVCMKCGRKIPIQCDCIRDFSSHIRQEHHFELDPRRAILYGYCEKCRDDEAEMNCPSEDKMPDNPE